MTTITRLAINNDKQSKTKSILIMAAIFLTTVLLTVICIFANGLLRFQKKNAETTYGKFYGAYRNVNEEQIREMERRSEFTDIGRYAYCGMLQSEVQSILAWADDTTLDLTNVLLDIDKGAVPKQADEIMAGPSFFEQMGYPDAKVGDTIEISYRVDETEKYQKKSFKISGILKEVDNGLEQKMYGAYVSEAFYKEHFPEEARIYTAYFRLDESVPITIDDAQEVLVDLASKCGIEEKQVAKNGYYLIWKLDPGYQTIVFCLIIALLVILFSAVVIYNIFQVGLVQKIQEYGKIKALGTTNKQMKKLIFREGMFLAVPSVPVGMLAGYLLAKGTFQWMMENSNAVSGTREMVQVSLFSVPMLLLSGVLAMITVIFALRKPMKIVADISPVEAVRYQEDTGRKNAGIRKGKKEVTVLNMTLANLASNKRRTISTIFTMGLSCVLFVVLANCIGNIDNEYAARKDIEHGQFQIELDYSTNDKAYPKNNLENILKDNPLNDELIDEIRQIPGVTDIETRTILSAVIDGEPDSVCVYNREDFEREANESGALGKVDYDEASRNGDIIYGWSYFMEENGYAIGQSISAELDNGEEKISYNGKTPGSFGSTDGGWVITQDTYEKMNLKSDSIGYLWVDCDEKNVEEVEQALNDLLEGKEHIEMDSYKQALKNADFSTQSVEMGVYAFLVILGLIGFMNMANTMIISIITKKQEYGILQAVGMTKGQMNRSLQLQGMIFTAGTLLVAWCVGLPIGYAVFCYGKSQGYFGMNVYHFPVTEMMCMTAALILLLLLLSLLLSKNVKKESLVERIRYQG